MRWVRRSCVITLVANLLSPPPVMLDRLAFDSLTPEPMSLFREQWD
jgi:hypothetical protein